MRTRFGPYTVDSETRQLFRGEKEVHISPKAFDLLCNLLARRPGVVTKSELFAVIWPNTFVAEANLNVLVGEVRRAIGDEARAPRFIRTAHGIGYAFSGEATNLDLDSAGSRPPHSTRYWLEARDRTYPLEAGDHLVGRDPGSEVWLNDSSVSRRHARIRIASGEPPTLEDLGSTNGTFIGRLRLTASAALSDGHRIRFGSFELTFRERAGRLAATRRVRRGPR